jgi:amidophosphoribosyltransferase
MCGIILGYNLKDVYEGSILLQHRGQEAVGIEGLGETGIDVVKWLGQVRAMSLETLERMLPGNKNKMYAGHVRYATKGSKDDLLQDAHPHTIGGTKVDNGSHIIIRGARKSIIHNGEMDTDLFSDSELSERSSGCDSEALLLRYEKEGVDKILFDIPYSYSAIIFDADTKRAIVFRDIHQMRPLCMGIKERKMQFASETRPLEMDGGRYLRDVKGGEVIYVDLDGNMLPPVKLVKIEPWECVFEGTYLHHPDSFIKGRKVSDSRQNLGVVACEEFHPKDITIVTFIPSSPEFAARGYAQVYCEMYGLDFNQVYKEVFYKLTKDRTFIQSKQGQREGHIKKNLFIYDNVNVEGETVLIIDDSIIRATESKRAIELLRGKKPAAIYFLSYTPPIGAVVDGVKHCCTKGVDMPPDPENLPEPYTYIIRQAGGSVDGVMKHIGADKLHYLSVDKMLYALGMKKENTCFGCMGGPIRYQGKLSL